MEHDQLLAEEQLASWMGGHAVLKLPDSPEKVA